MRPIDADALLKNTKAYFGDCIDKQDSEIIDNTILVHNKNISKIIRQAPTVETPRGEWISVEERLPKRRMECLCLYQFGSNPRYRYYGVLFFNPEEYADNGYVKGPHFNNEGMDDLKVVYWMPLPEKPKIDMRGEGE